MAKTVRVPLKNITSIRNDQTIHSCQGLVLIKPPSYYTFPTICILDQSEKISRSIIITTLVPDRDYDLYQLLHHLNQMCFNTVRLIDLNLESRTRKKNSARPDNFKIMNYRK